MAKQTTDRWTTAPDDFHYILLELVNPEANEYRYYYLGWQPTLLDDGAVVRIYGRKGETQHLHLEPFVSLDEAWPTIRGLIRTRLRHGYQIVAPEAYANSESVR